MRSSETLRLEAEDLFGPHPDAPMARYDHMGLIWLLKGERVVELTATGAISARNAGCGAGCAND
jgi:hypothetical protein